MEKPILFNTEMVQAILEGKKVVTRRLVKNKYPNADIKFFENKYGKRLVHMQNDAPKSVKHEDGYTSHSLVAMEEIKKPYQIGDILYVRETWLIQSMSNYDKKVKFLFKAEDNHKLKEVIVSNERYEKLIKFSNKNGWQPSLFMPKEAARIFLKVTSVRAERLQDIQDSECLKEGIRKYSKDGNAIKYAVNEEQFNWFDMPRNPVEVFKILWNTTVKKTEYKDYGFEANPWVWVIEFKRIEKE